MEIAYVDITCLEANIHFSTDWILREMECVV